MGVFLNGLRAFTGTLFFAQCFHCGGYLGGGELFCDRCRFPSKVGRAICQRCGAVTSHLIQSCGECRKSDWPEYLKTRSEYLLEPHWRKFLHKVKHQSHLGYFRRFLEEMPLEQAKEFGSYPLVAVPLHEDRMWQRGFNQSGVLARELSARFGNPVLKGLEKIKSTEPQSLLSREKRKSNLNSAFVWKGESPPRVVLVVDDVITTGSTFRSVARTLRKAGAKSVLGWSLFRTKKTGLPRSSPVQIFYNIRA